MSLDLQWCDMLEVMWKSQFWGTLQVIPNAEHPSDHFPVFVTFMLKVGECRKPHHEPR